MIDGHVLVDVYGEVIRYGGYAWRPTDQYRNRVVDGKLVRERLYVTQTYGHGYSDETASYRSNIDKWFRLPECNTDCSSISLEEQT